MAGLKFELAVTEDQRDGSYTASLTISRNGLTYTTPPAELSATDHAKVLTEAVARFRPMVDILVPAMDAMEPVSNSQAMHDPEPLVSRVLSQED
jgi:hypothetical protein